MTHAETQELWNLDDVQRVISLGNTRAIEFDLIRDRRPIHTMLIPSEPAVA